MKPSAEDIEKHNVTHLPYRSWCEVCAKAVGREDPHYRKSSSERERGGGLPKISLDYQELLSVPKKNPKPEDNVVKIIVAKDEDSGAVLAYRVTTKGPGDTWMIKRLVKDIEEMGRQDIILKTDGEPAMIALQSAVQAARSGRTVLENPPQYNPQSNGACEKAVQDVDGQIRKLKIALEARLGMEIPEESNAMQWMIIHGAYLLTRFSLGHDGMTPHERLTGRKWSTPMVEFGEAVLAKLAPSRVGRGQKKAQKSKLAPRSVRGVWVGQVGRTGEHIVVKQNGDAVRCRTIRRVPAEDRWDADLVASMEAVPRLPAPSRADPGELVARLADEERGVPERRRRAERHERVRQSEGSGVGVTQPEPRDPREPEVRRFRINENLLGKYGFTENCPGCDWKLAGRTGHREHTQACRDRLHLEMLADEKDKRIIEEEAERMKLHKQERDQDEDQTKTEPNVIKEATAQSDPDHEAEPELEITMESGKLETIPEDDEDGKSEIDADVDMGGVGHPRAVGGDHPARGPRRDLQEARSAGRLAGRTWGRRRGER